MQSRRHHALTPWLPSLLEESASCARGPGQGPHDDCKRLQTFAQAMPVSFLGPNNFLADSPASFRRIPRIYECWSRARAKAA
jgi:hypothetical protein